MPQHSLDCIHQNVLLPISCSLVPSYWKRALTVILPMWYDLHVSSDSKSSESKRSICMEFLHAYIPIDMVRMSQTFQKWVSPKIHQHGASSCVLYQYDSNGSATSMWYYHYYLISFGMNMCITTIEIQQTIHFRCKTIEGIIEINRVTIILLKWITVLR